jgi:hypothetical protein
MSNIRQIVRANVEDETLRDYLGARYPSASHQDKQELLETLRRRGEIDREVENILNAFLHDIQRNSPSSKKRRIKISILAGLNLFLTVAIAYAVNEKAWVFLVFLGIANLVILIYPLINEE